MTPAAIQKAESLARFARNRGSPLSEFQIALTLGEGYELLDYLASGALGRFANQSALERDILQAKVKGDPWEVLREFTLHGFEIVRADLVLN